MEVEARETKSTYQSKLLKGIKPNEITEAMVQIKAEKIHSLISYVYVVICIMIIFMSLYFMNHNRFMFSSCVVLGIILLHFKSFLLETIYNVISIQKDKQQ